MITSREVRHMEILTRISNVTRNVTKYSITDLMIMKEAIDQELAKRGY